MTELLHRDLTGRIIGVYYTVYNKLSQTYPEFIYERVMIALLERLGIRCVQQGEYEIRYKEWLVGVQRLDIFIADKAVVELKVADSIDPIHVAQLLSYLKTVSREVGLLFRFGGPEPEFARRVLTPQVWHETLNPDSAVLQSEKIYCTRSSHARSSAAHWRSSRPSDLALSIASMPMPVITN